MTNFKQISTLDYKKHLLAPTVISRGFGFELLLRFDKRENLLEARYSGPGNIWFNVLCYLIEGQNYLDLKKISKDSLKDIFQDDPLFLECFEDLDLKIMHPSFELLELALSIYKGELRNYNEQSKIVCRCSGTTEDDLLLVLHEAEFLNDLALKSGAGLGCRSCVKQLEKFFSRTKVRRYKEKSNADWILMAQDLLEKSIFTELEIGSFKNGMLILRSSKKLNQVEEEELTVELQDYFLALDPELSVLLDLTQDLK